MIEKHEGICAATTTITLQNNLFWNFLSEKQIRMFNQEENLGAVHPLGCEWQHQINWRKFGFHFICRCKLTSEYVWSTVKQPKLFNSEIFRNCRYEIHIRDEFVACFILIFQIFFHVKVLRLESCFSSGKDAWIFFSHTWH